MCGVDVSCTDVLDEDKMNVELVVQCVRMSDMPQTHHHALLLLGTVAGIFPVSTTLCEMDLLLFQCYVGYSRC